MRQLSSSRPFYGGASAGYLAPAPALLHARMSLSFIFFVNGFVVASWLPHIPEEKGRLALGDFRLGLALFAMGRLLRHGELARNRPINTSKGREQNEADSLSPILFATPRARRDRRPVQLGSAGPENRERSAT